MYTRWFSTKASLAGQNKNENNFKMSQKTIDDPIQNITIPINGKKEKDGKKKSITWNQDSFSFWPKTKIGNIYVKRKREIKRLNKLSPEGMCFQNSSLKKEGSHYYIIIPFIKEKEIKVTEDFLKVMATDPGICTFQTTFDGNKFIEYAPGGEKSNEKDKIKGKGSIQRIHCLCKKIDTLQSKIDKSKKEKYENKKERKKMKKLRYKMRKEKKKIQKHIQNLTREAHIHIAKEWSENYDAIMISKFNVSSMVNNQNKKRKLNSETTRKLLNWSHFKFRQRLKQMSEVTGCEVKEVGEHYSSKTCSNCGSIHWKLGGNRLFKCPQCNLEIKRDFNGAKNIFMMNLEKCGFILHLGH
jgi:IS605 OrfB family transposase